MDRGDRSLIFNSAMNRALRRATATDEHKGLFRRMQARREIRQLAAAEAHARFEAEGDNFAGPLSFFTWVIEHFDEIMSMIKQLIELFDTDE